MNIFGQNFFHYNDKNIAHTISDTENISVSYRPSTSIKSHVLFIFTILFTITIRRIPYKINTYKCEAASALRARLSRAAL